MFCPNCGAENDNGATYCRSCNSMLSNSSSNYTNQNNNYYTTNTTTFNPQDVPVFSYAHSIILLLVGFFCCGGPLGIIFPILSLVAGDDVKKLVANGDINGAKLAKQNSDKWIKISYLVLGILGFLEIVCALIYFFVIAAAVSAGY